MNVCPHVNKAEYETALDIIETSVKFQRMKALADAGNVQAAWFYGNILLTGGWDESRMGVDFLRGTLIPETTDPLQDPYLLVPRDQYAAVQYHKIAATLPDANQLEVQYSRSILAYCRKKADIGYYGTEKPNRFLLAQFEAFAKKAKPEDVKANPFFPYPYKRPEVKNPKTKMFGFVASIMYTGSLIMLMNVIILLIIMPFGSIILARSNQQNESFIILLVNFVLIIFAALLIPLFIACFISDKFGVKDGMPLCSCATIKKAYQDNLDKLPEDCRIGDDAFASAPFWIRNFNHIKQGYFFIVLLISIAIVSLQLSENIDLKSFEAIFAAWSVLGFSLASLIFDRNFRLVDRACEKASGPMPFNGFGYPVME